MTVLSTFNMGLRARQLIDDSAGSVKDDNRVNTILLVLTLASVAICVAALLLWRNRASLPNFSDWLKRCRSPLAARGNDGYQILGEDEPASHSFSESTIQFSSI